jgi:hypothetical protein
MKLYIGSRPNRIQLENKDPRGFREFYQRFAEHSAKGHANTLRGVAVAPAAALHDGAAVRARSVPSSLSVGDEDESALTPRISSSSARVPQRVSWSYPARPISSRTKSRDFSIESPTISRARRVRALAAARSALD